MLTNSRKITPVPKTLRRTQTQPCLVIAIAGLSASGKTTLAQDLSEELNSPLIQMDDYYKDIPANTAVESLNWDDPEMFHLDEWREHLEALAQGQTVQIPRYDFCTSLRSGSRTATPSPTIIAEGQFALHPNAIPDHHCINIFVELDIEAAFSRRLLRDTSERGRTPDSIQTQWENHVLPAWQNWVEPSRLRADLVLSGTANRLQNLQRTRHIVEKMRASLAYLR
jgi:uridine kinase